MHIPSASLRTDRTFPIRLLTTKQISGLLKYRRKARFLHQKRRRSLRETRLLNPYRSLTMVSGWHMTPIFPETQNYIKYRLLEGTLSNSLHIQVKILSRLGLAMTNGSFFTLSGKETGTYSAWIKTEETFNRWRMIPPMNSGRAFLRMTQK